MGNGYEENEKGEGEKLVVRLFSGGRREEKEKEEGGKVAVVVRWRGKEMDVRDEDEDGYEEEDKVEDDDDTKIFYRALLLF